MRRTMLVGLSLAVAAVVAVLVGAASDLELESVALVGAASGAVVALVPDRTPLARVLGFFVGFAVAWVGYAVRATSLPDSDGGRAAAVAAVVLLCTALVVASRDRLPLWAPLLGAGVFAGSYELTYVAAPPVMASTSVSTATTLLLTLALGFLAVVATAPAPARPSVPADPASPSDPSDLPVQRSEERATGSADDTELSILENAR